MNRPKIAIILGSTRPGRNGRAMAEWVLERAKSRPDADYELIDLLDYPLPHLLHNHVEKPMRRLIIGRVQ